MIDEYPILAVAAACASGPTRFNGVGELRVKESDRIAAMARGLAACGADVDERPDGLTIQGRGALSGGASIAAAHDHRIAMAFLIAGLAASEAVRVDGVDTIETSFPGFAALMQELGANIQRASQ
jgi:3-phosphoshikimate 1-carboxyvinyltransferase